MPHDLMGKETKSNQTMSQFWIKSDMGIWKGCRVEFKFHWRFWEPIDAVGGNVYFGRYVEVTSYDED